MGAGDCGSADDQSRWIKNLGELGLFGTLGNFKLSTNQSTSQTIKLQTNQLANLSAGQTSNHLTNLTHALANRSGISASLSRSADTKVLL